jgi:hypothetical protein
MIDPDNIPTNATVELALPRVIIARDYHEFNDIQTTLRHQLGLDVYVTEVGFLAPEYIGLIHINTESHNQLVMELTAYYNELDEIE